MTIIKITNCIIINEHGEIAISFSLVEHDDDVFDANICRAPTTWSPRSRWPRSTPSSPPITWYKGHAHLYVGMY
jgi:hypothetical protein